MENFKKYFLLFLILLNFCTATPNVQPVFNLQTLSVLCYKSNDPGSTNENEAAEKVPCPLPVSQLKSGRHEIGVSGDYYTEPPEWLNVTLATIGQDLLRKNFVGLLYYSAASTLIVGASSTDVRRVLASGGNVIKVKKAAQRNLGTILNFLAWSNGDIMPTPGLSPTAYRWNQSTLFETMNLIRTTHEKVQHQAILQPEHFKAPILTPETEREPLDERLWEAFRQDLLASRFAKFQNKPIFPPGNGGTKVYFNQFAMMMQYWALCAPPIMHQHTPKSLLMIGQPTEEELLGFLHFWSFLAHVMGQRPEYNPCMQPSIPEAKIYFQKLMEEYLIPALFHLDYESKLLIEVNAKAYTDTFRFIDLYIILRQLCEDFLGIEAKNIQSIMPVHSRLYVGILNYLRRFATDPERYSPIRFVILGMMQTNTLKYFHFNTLRPNSFANGMVAYNEKVLANVNLFQWQNETYNYR